MKKKKNDYLIIAYLHPLPKCHNSKECNILTLCLVGVKIERMENIGRKIGWKTVFSTVWQRRENGEEGKLGRKFSLLGPQFSSSQIGRKIWRGKCCESTFTQIPSPNVHNNPARQNKKEAKNNHQTQHHHQTLELSTEN